MLDNGVMYRVLEEGHGTKKPTPRSIVYAHYTGRLIDGTVFDTTEGGQLPAHSTLIFELQLIKIER